MQIFSDRTFLKQDMTGETLPQAEYVGCRFKGLDMSEGDLSGCVFSECRFEGCNLSLARFTGTAMRDVVFIECKMLGVHFEDCNRLGLRFSLDGCLCDNCSFFELKLPGAVFKNTRLREADFTDCDLGGATIEKCDLTAAVFDNTILERADMRLSWGFSIDPAKNRIRRARFSLHSITGLLNAYDLRIE